MSALFDSLQAAERADPATSSSAALAAARPTLQVTQGHFLRALGKVRPSVSVADQRRYDSMLHKLRHARSHVDPETKEGGTDAAGGTGAPSADE